MHGERGRTVRSAETRQRRGGEGCGRNQKNAGVMRMGNRQRGATRGEDTRRRHDEESVGIGCSREGRRKRSNGRTSVCEQELVRLRRERMPCGRKGEERRREEESGGEKHGRDDGHAQIARSNPQGATRAGENTRRTRGGKRRRRKGGGEKADRAKGRNSRTSTGEGEGAGRQRHRRVDHQSKRQRARNEYDRAESAPRGGEESPRGRGAQRSERRDAGGQGGKKRVEDRVENRTGRDGRLSRRKYRKGPKRSEEGGCGDKGQSRRNGVVGFAWCAET